MGTVTNPGVSTKRRACHRPVYEAEPALRRWSSSSPHLDCRFPCTQRWRQQHLYSGRHSPVAPVQTMRRHFLPKTCVQILLQSYRTTQVTPVSVQPPMLHDESALSSTATGPSSASPSESNSRSPARSG